LKSNDNGGKVKHRLPVFSQDIQADVPLKVDIGMVDLLGAFDFGSFVWKTLADSECEDESTALVHPLIWFNSEIEVQGIIGIREVRFHGAG
jgi:hypothetical protein